MSLPEHVRSEFLEDVVAFCAMFYDKSQRGIPASVHGEQLQNEMCKKYDPALMQWVHDEIGWFGGDDETETSAQAEAWR